ncbi:MAG TPA: DUF4232 domain-containing protein [Streptosporangiaceae bacterium]|nr:DUF4232 domain-containing protein [Streptosporangiaceae bacterium]
MTAPAPAPAPAPVSRRARITAGAPAAAGLACVAALLAACGSSAGSSGAARSTVTVTATPTASASTAPAASAAATSSAPGVPACPTRSLQVKLGVAQGTAGSVYTVLDFVNISNVTCTLYGYPGVSLAGGKPVSQIGLAAVEDHTSARELVTLAPQAVANALLKIIDAGNYSVSTCGPATAHYLQIFPPNQTTPTYLAYTTQACAKSVALLTIGAVRPGSGSSS